MTPEEKKVLNLSVELWNEFLKLPVQHKDDVSEMKRDIHNIQNRLMARPTERIERSPILKSDK